MFVNLKPTSKTDLYRDINIHISLHHFPFVFLSTALVNLFNNAVLIPVMIAVHNNINF